LGSTVKERAVPVWKPAKIQFERGLQWLERRRRPILVIIVSGLLLYLGLPYAPKVWSAYKSTERQWPGHAKESHRVEDAPRLDRHGAHDPATDSALAHRRPLFDVPRKQGDDLQAPTCTMAA
jgi:hypothetical protein